MYILIISRGYPTSKYPMNGIFEFDQAKALAQYGHKVVYAAVDLRSIRRWRRWGVHYSMKDGVQLCSIDIPAGALGANMLDHIGEKALKLLYRYIVKQHGRPDIVHAHFLSMAVLGSRLCLYENLPLIITEHSSIMNKVSLPKLTLNRAKKAYSQANQMIAVSTGLGQHIFEATGINCLCIPNIVDLDHFTYRKTANMCEAFTFISVGSLIHRKGHDILLTAFSHILKKHPDCRLVIVGDGTSRQELCVLTDKLNISSRVRFMGLLNRSHIAEAFSAADAFVLASRRETFGVVYIEAMAAGLPVVATVCGGPEDFVTDEVGLLVPSNDVARLSEAMEAMIVNQAQYNKQQISEYAKRHFSPEIIAKQLTNVYQSVLGNYKS